MRRINWLAFSLGFAAGVLAALAATIAALFILTDHFRQYSA